jgi:ABC-type transporter Mla maintaining outer membrane lipid asymmetry ATPase subunit MlaF
MSTVLAIDRLRKNYMALRPIRIEALALEPGRRVALLGIDSSGAEVLVNLLTGATLPDEGTIRIFGRDTAAIENPDDWFATLDRFGIISARAVLVDGMTAAQNLAMAFTLSVDPVSIAIMTDVRRLAVESGVPLDALDRPFGTLTVDVKARCHLARAIAADPAVLLLEHANALTAPADAPAFGRDIARIAARRRLAVLAITADEAFAHAVAGKTCALDAATGKLVAQSGWRRWIR